MIKVWGGKITEKITINQQSMERKDNAKTMLSYNFKLDDRK